ncbi:MAG: IclR family transcriptional regulator [Rhodospirillaceae bacterium]|nr:IclR family transcriptional regulator [Rhodospirillaceae bacterium]
MGADEKNDSSTALKSVRRALTVLEHVASHPGRAAELAKQLDVSWATLHRTLQELEQTGYLQRDPETNIYRIGPRMWYIGAAYIADHPILELARPYLDEAVKLGDITVQFIQRMGYQVVTLFNDQLPGDDITKAGYGFHFPLHCGSKGQVLLAHSAPDVIEGYLTQNLESLTPYTITDPEELRPVLAKIQKDGYAVTVSDVQVFAGSMSAPVFDRHGELAGGVCFVMLKSVIEDSGRRDALLEALLQTSQAISMGLGWRPGSTAASNQ